MSAIAPIGIPHPSTIEVATDDPVARANSVLDEKHPDFAEKPQIRERVWGLNARTDATVTWEEYRHWAVIEREIEMEENRKYKELRGPLTMKTIITDRFSSGKTQTENKRKASIDAVAGVDSTAISASASNDEIMKVTDAEWRQAARALRTAGWGTIFYLVTTDILGWSSAPAVFAAVGFGAGAALFIIFGLAAGFAGFSLWRVYLALDSARFPMISFGDPYLRIFGRIPRHLINIMQALQQFMSVAVVILGNSTLLTQIAKEKICFVVVIVIVTVVGIFSGLLRRLQHLGWICNLSVWLNVCNFIIIMVAAGNNPINYQAVFASTTIKVIEPVRTFAGAPPAQYQQAAVGFAASFGAVSVMVYAYAGALLFVAFMAEMRHPWDFWKGMLCAQCFICFAYLLFGLFVYAEWGQYAIFNINTVVLPYSLQTAGNVLSLLTGWFAVFLYFNVGMKTVYQEVFMEILKFPALYTKKGRWCWYALGPIYWVLAFIVAAAVPNLQGLVGIIGALFALNFTYSFPVLAYLGYRVTDDAKLEGEGFDPYTGVTTRHDSGFKRYARGYMKGALVNIPVTIFIFAALACSGMGAWAAVETLIAIFGPKGTTATHFGCGQPT